jgi:hypothetical protein
MQTKNTAKRIDVAADDCWGMKAIWHLEFASMRTGIPKSVPNRNSEAANLFFSIGSH